jgi:hypothetical protein
MACSMASLLMMTSSFVEQFCYVGKLGTAQGITLI